MVLPRPAKLFRGKGRRPNDRSRSACDSPRRLGFRTIQVCPKDLPTSLRQAGGAENRLPGWSATLIARWGGPLCSTRSGVSSLHCSVRAVCYLRSSSGGRAQQSAMPIVGFVTGRSGEASVRQAAAFRKGLNDRLR